MKDSILIPGWLAGLYPFSPRSFVTGDGAAMSYLDEGPRSDEAVLMLHGNPTWSFYYRNLVKAVSKEMRCVVPDHVGMGLSEKPQDYAYDLETRISDIEGLVESLQLRRIHLVLHDWGGAIGFGFAARHPQRIGRIVILNTAAFPSTRIPFRIAACRFPGIGPLIVRKFNGFAGPATRMAMHRRVLRPDERRAYLFPYDSWENRVAVNAFVQDIPMSAVHKSWGTLLDVEEGLKQFRANQVLLLWGGKDFCFNDHYFEHWTKLFPEARQNHIADAGHYVLEDASETAVPAAAGFIVDGATS